MVCRDHSVLALCDLYEWTVLFSTVHGYNTNKDDFIPPDTFDTPDAKSTRSVGIMKPPGPVRARPGPTVIVTKEEVEDIEEEEKQERLHGLQTVTYSADEWEDVPQPQKRMELGMPRTSRGSEYHTELDHLSGTEKYHYQFPTKLIQ